jgi:hypothetical protein
MTVSQIAEPALFFQGKADTATMLASPLLNIENLDSSGQPRRADINAAPSYIFII